MFMFGDEVLENKFLLVFYLIVLEWIGLEVFLVFVVEDFLVGVIVVLCVGLGVVLIFDFSFVWNYSVEEKEKLNFFVEGKDFWIVIEMLDKKIEK